MMTPKRKLFINLVAMAILAVVMVGWVLLRLIGSGVVDQPYKVRADFASSGGVFTNQEVTYRGVLIGKVGDMDLNEDGVDIELVIDPEWRDRIPADVVASVRNKSAVGEQYVNLTPLSEGGEMLQDGDEIARAETSLPVDFQELLKSLDKVVADVPPEQAARVVSNLADGLGGREEEIATILESLATLSDTFASVAEEQKSLIDNSTTAGREFLRTKDSFSAAIRAADEVFAGLGDEPEETRAFLAANDKLAREGIELLARHGASLRKGIAALADFTTFQLDNKEMVVQSLDYTPDFLKAIEEASVPWESPDGREFYRIRVGLVNADERSQFWPCRYGPLPKDYNRFPFEREEKKKVLDEAECNPDQTASARSLELTDSLISALEAWAAEQGRATTVAESPLSFGSTVPVVATDITFGWPLDGLVTSYYGPRWGRMHMGIDIDGNSGDPIVASAPGRVVTAGYNAGGYGNVVVIDHGGGFSSLYAHMSSINVSVGDEVESGAFLGGVGCTGHCFGDHLHFEIRVNGNAVDPMGYLPGSTLFVASEQEDRHSDIGGP